MLPRAAAGGCHTRTQRASLILTPRVCRLGFVYDTVPSRDTQSPSCCRLHVLCFREKDGAWREPRTQASRDQLGLLRRLPWRHIRQCLSPSALRGRDGGKARDTHSPIAKVAGSVPCTHQALSMGRRTCPRGQGSSGHCTCRRASEEPRFRRHHCPSVALRPSSAHVRPLSWLPRHCSGAPQGAGKVYAVQHARKTQAYGTEEDQENQCS